MDSFGGGPVTGHIGKTQTLDLLSSTTTSAPDAKSESCCLSAAITARSRRSGNTSAART
jgi:hypothetical protein